MRGRVVIAVVALTLGLPAVAQAAFPGVNGKIAFQTNRDGVNKIYTMDPDGSAPTRVDTEGEWWSQYDIRSPAWSPDGRQLAFSCGGDSSICKINTAGGPPTEVFGHWGSTIDPTWSPDGTHMSFSYENQYCDFGNECWYHLDVAVMKADGSDFALVADY